MSFSPNRTEPGNEEGREKKKAPLPSPPKKEVLVRYKSLLWYVIFVIVTTGRGCVCVWFCCFFLFFFFLISVYYQASRRFRCFRFSCIDMFDSFYYVLFEVY